MNICRVVVTTLPSFLFSFPHLAVVIYDAFTEAGFSPNRLFETNGRFYLNFYSRFSDVVFPDNGWLRPRDPLME